MAKAKAKVQEPKATIQYENPIGPEKPAANTHQAVAPAPAANAPMLWLPGCKDCMSRRWKKIADVVVPDDAGKLDKSALYQCGNCKRVISVKEIKETTDPTIRV